jgi:hypothetical protein
MHKTSEITFDFIKAVAFLFFISSLIPWVNFGINDFDSQPWSFIFAIIFLVCLKKKKFPVHSLKILTLVIIGLFLTFLKTDSSNFFFLLRAIVNYLSLPILYIAFYNYFIRYNFPLKLFVTFNLLWISVGLIQLYFPEIGLSIVNRRNIDIIRGASSLAPEPSFFGIYLFFSSWVLIETKNLVASKNIKILLFINFLIILFVAKSTMSLLFYVIVITLFYVKHFFYFFFYLKLSKKILVPLLFTIAIFIALIIFNIFFYNTRLYFLIDAFFNNQSILEIIKTDDSVNSRVESIYFSVIGSLKNYLLPGGIDTFIEMRKEILNSMKYEIFYNKTESNLIMSWIGSIIYELGIFGIVIIALFFKAMYRNFRGSLFYFVALFVILFSAIPVSFPLITMLFALLVYKKNIKSEKNF